MIALLLKQKRSASIAAMADELGVTYESLRQQITMMERQGWVRGRVQRTVGSTGGRPVSHYTLTTAGDHLFAKNYDLLTSRMIEMVAAELGMDALKRVLASITEAEVARWAPRMNGKSLREKLVLLRELYMDDDPFMEVEKTAQGFRLIERNCPYLNVAMHHPALCSTTVNTLTRLLGYKVIREERFQSGDQRCVFRVLADEPVDPAKVLFELELPPVT